MAKFIKFVNEEMNHNEFQFKEGLNEDIITMNDDYCSPGGIYFTDTNWFTKWAPGYGDKEMYWVFDVEIPDGEPFIAFDSKYKAQKVILSNPRKLWNNDKPVNWADVNPELYNICINSLNYVDNFNYSDTIYMKKFIAKKDSAHKLLYTSVVRE